MYTIVNFNNNAAITQISPTTDKAVVTQDNDSAFTIKVPIGTQTVKANITLADKSGLLYINDRLVNDGKVQTFTINGENKSFALKAYAEDHTTYKDYTLTIIPTDEVSNPRCV